MKVLTTGASRVIFLHSFCLSVYQTDTSLHTDLYRGAIIGYDASLNKEPAFLEQNWENPLLALFPVFTTVGS